MSHDFFFGMFIGSLLSLAFYFFTRPFFISKSQLHDETKEDPANWWKNGKNPYDD